MRKLTAKQLDKEIDAIYRRNCSGITIDIMDISKVFAAGRQAAAEGRNIEEAVIAIVQAIRKN